MTSADDRQRPAPVSLEDPSQNPSPESTPYAKNAATMSLLMSAARLKRQNSSGTISFDDEDEAGEYGDGLTSENKLYSLRRLARGSPARNSHDEDDGILAVEGIDRFRQLCAIRIIERHYTRHVRVQPAQLFLDKARTKHAEWGKLTFTTTKGAGCTRTWRV